MGKNDKDNDIHTDRGLLTRIIEGVIIFAILAFVIKLGVEYILSVKVPLIIIAVICGAVVIGYRIYRAKRDHDDY